MITVLCTSCGNESFPEVVRSLHALRSYKVVGVDSDCRSAGLWRTPYSYVVPPRKDAGELISKLLEVIRDERVDVLLPLSTDDQLFYSQPDVKAALSTVRIAIGQRPSVETASDKLLTYQAVDGLAPLPAYRISSHVDETIAAIEEYSSRGLRCVVKRPLGTGSQGVKILNPGRKRHEDIWIVNSTTVYAEDFCSDLARYQKPERLMVTEFLPGRHVSVDCFRTDAGVFVAQTREEWSTGYGVGVGGRTIDCDEAFNVAKTIADKLDLSYAFNIELKADESARLKLLEINPRMGASVGISIRTGYNFPLMLVEYALGRRPSEPQRLQHLEVRRTVERLYMKTVD